MNEAIKNLRESEIPKAEKRIQQLTELLNELGNKDNDCRLSVIGFQNLTISRAHWMPMSQLSKHDWELSDKAIELLAQWCRNELDASNKYLDQLKKDREINE